MIIDVDDLEMDDDLALDQGQPFTGTVQGFYPNGTMWVKSWYIDGFQRGLCREWYKNGQLKLEWFAIRGCVDGKLTEWHQNGQIKIVATYTKGIELTYDERSDAGLPILHREIDRQSELWKYANSLKT